MAQQPSRLLRIVRRAVIALAVVVLAASWYVGTYAPALWLIYRCPLTPRMSSDVLDAYGPVEWLIDETPLSEPLYAWADAWGVGDDQIREEMARIGAIPLIDPPWVNLRPESRRPAGP